MKEKETSPAVASGRPRALLVNAGPHKSGCTNRALEEVAAELERQGVDTQIFWVGNKPVGACIGCRRCKELGLCVFDDRVNDFVNIARGFDGFVLGSPVHFGAATGTATAFYDRAFYVLLQNAAPEMRMKVGAAVASARRAGNTTTIDQINRYFQLLQMPIVSSRYWNIVHGYTPDQVEKDAEGLQAMRVLADNMAFLIRAIRAARAAGIELPEQEQTVYTNFIR